MLVNKIVKFMKKHTWLLLILSIALFIPQSFSYQAKLNMRVVVTGMGVDKSEDGYSITAQVVMPSPGSESGGGSATLGMISEEGKNISEGVQKIAYKIGKTAGLSHMSFLVVGQSMLNENLAEVLDFFVRDKELNSSVMLLVSPTTAKDMIEQTKNLELSASVGLQKVFIYKQGSFNGVMMPVVEFIGNAFSLSQSSAVSGIFISKEGEEELGKTTSESVEKQSSQGEESGQNQEEENSSSGDSKSQDGRIKYYNDVYYFKNGKYINKLDKEEELLGFFLTNTARNSGEITVKNVTGGSLKDATIGLQFRSGKTRKKVKEKEGKPVFVFNVKLRDVQVVEILNNGGLTEKIYRDANSETVETIKNAIKQEIEKNITKTFEKAKSDGVDIFKFADTCYSLKPKLWKEFYDQHGEAYLDDVELEVNVDIKNMN